VVQVRSPRPARSVRGTPTLLRLATALTVLAGIAFGGLGLQGLTGRSQAVDRARAETADLVRLQTIRTKVVTADAAAGVDVLLGPDQVTLTPHDYDWALQPAVIGMSIASRQADDAYPLAVANLRLTQYTGQVGAARNLSVSGNSAGAADALTAAAVTLQGEILPRLLAVQRASERRLATDQDDAARGPLLAYAGAALGLLTLIAIQLWLTARTRRILNVPLAVASILLAVMTVAGLVIVSASQRQVDGVSTGIQPLVRQLVEARVAAFNARSVETLSVVARSETAQDPTWRASLASAQESLARAEQVASPTPPHAGADAPRAEVQAATTLLGDYAAVHEGMVRLARTARVRAQDRDAERVLATSPAPDALPGAFESFDVATGALLARQVEAADDGWSGANSHLVLAGWLWLVAGLGAAVLAWRGLSARLREYD